MRVVVIGAGVGGLTAAAALARAGADVEVLEAHVYPGGCAGTFYYQGYRFDAGATLAGGFYPGGPMDRVAHATGVAAWPARPVDPAMVVHLPDGERIARWGSDRRHAEHRAAFGRAGDGFWRWQEATADALWDLALALPPWPPQSAAEAMRLAHAAGAWLARDPRRRLSPALAADGLRPVAARLAGAPDRLRLFVDAGLLIAAQATSARVNALYGAAALDLPRRGVVELAGGMGAIAEALAARVRAGGGRVRYKHAAARIVFEGGRPVAVETARGRRFAADVVVANLPAANLARLLGDAAPPALRRAPAAPRDGWGAFTVHVGVDAAVVPPDAVLHHQVVRGTPLGEGNSVFVSVSPGWDPGRAPAGRRAVTISTHTALAPWWEVLAADRAAYARRKAAWAARCIEAAEVALPGLRDAAALVLPGTPVTFARFTGRADGWVGGFPQTHLFRARGPGVAPGIWMVGDSIFPGQSTAATALGGLRVAAAILDGAAAARPRIARWSSVSHVEPPRQASSGVIVD